MHVPLLLAVQVCDWDAHLAAVFTLRARRQDARLGSRGGLRVLLLGDLDLLSLGTGLGVLLCVRDLHDLRVLVGGLEFPHGGLKGGELVGAAADVRHHVPDLVPFGE